LQVDTRDAQHRIRFVQLLHAASNFLDVKTEVLGQLRLLGALVRHEFMQRWINQPNRHGQPSIAWKMPMKSRRWKRQELVQSGHARLFRLRKDHFLNGTLTLRPFFRMLEVGKEHVLGAAQADAFRAHFARLARSCGVSALVRTRSLRISSTHFIRVV